MSHIEDVLDSLASDLDGVVLFSPEADLYEQLTDDHEVVVISAEDERDAERFVELPVEFSELSDRVRFGIEGALAQEFLGENDQVLCLATTYGDSLDTAMRVRAGEFTETGVYDLFVNSRAEPGVIRNVVDVAVELGKKGQKGKPVGALFVVGDAGKVMNKSRPLSYNPFEKSHVHVGDPIVNVMLKEFSRLDGAFVISDGGKIVSAYRYLEPSAEGVDIPKGLGARHMAAGAITRDTNAIAIVLSESDGLVRAFKRGELILELDPEEY
ncbi:diadenylate cyclase DacZ [Halorhabdus salina]|uniref:diadenylate cyclase DacZ n=1 Tax=Halorhabdus salina TaxID=2750670 RepID=UPI0015EF99C2|nr:diadenylate cyclase DacZ [Halorhabdus salina]